MMVSNAAIPSVTNMPLAQKVVFVHFVMSAVSYGSFATAPYKGKTKAGVLVNHIANGGIQLIGGDVLGVETADDPLCCQSPGMASCLHRPQITTITEHGDKIAG